VSLVEVGKVLPGTADRVWGLLGDDGTWPNCLPRLKESVLVGGTGRGPVGAVRQLVLDDGSRVDERLTAYDERARSLSYAFEGTSPFPVHDYLGTVEVHPVHGEPACFVRWSGSFAVEPDEVERFAKTFTGLYVAFLESLEQHLLAVPA
jgi:hypothetical protein